MEEAINRIIGHALNQTNQNVSAAARLLDGPRDYIRYRLKKNPIRDLRQRALGSRGSKKGSHSRGVDFGGKRLHPTTAKKVSHKRIGHDLGNRDECASDY